MIGLTRIVMIVSFAVICFVLIEPLAIQKHQTFIEVGIPAIFAIYVVVNIVLWRRIKPRA